MYALKIITVKNDGNPVECVTALGDCYRLEFNPAIADPKVVARVHYTKDDNTPCIEINRGNEALSPRLIIRLFGSFAVLIWLLKPR